MSLLDIYKGKLIGLKAYQKFNIWDEDWENGYWNSSGAKASSNTSIRSKNLIPVKPDTTYYMKFPTTYTGARVCQFGEDENFLSRGTFTYNGTFKTSSNTYFLAWSSDGTAYNNDICINISKTKGSPKNGDYVPYHG